MKYFQISFVLFLLSACVAPAPQLTPLEIQSIQTRDFSESKDVIFASVMSVFQDLGYSVNSADKDTGLITAESPARSSNLGALIVSSSGMTEVRQTKATAFIETIGNTTKVRLNFVLMSSRSFGYGQNDRHDTPLLDSNIYQNAFERIENAVFVRSSH